MLNFLINCTTSSCSPFRFKGVWSGEFKPYNIGREFAELGLYLGASGCKEDPRLRTPTPLSPDPIGIVP
jgi:hypothetical protein